MLCRREVYFFWYWLSALSKYNENVLFLNRMQLNCSWCTPGSLVLWTWIFFDVQVRWKIVSKFFSFPQWKSIFTAVLSRKRAVVMRCSLPMLVLLGDVTLKYFSAGRTLFLHQNIYLQSGCYSVERHKAWQVSFDSSCYTLILVPPLGCAPLMTISFVFKINVDWLGIVSLAASSLPGADLHTATEKARALCRANELSDSVPNQLWHS